MSSLLDRESTGRPDAPGRAALAGSQAGPRFEGGALLPPRTPRAPSLHGVRLRDPGGQEGGGGGASGSGKEHAGAPALPLLRRPAGRHPHRRAGDPPGHSRLPYAAPSASCRRTPCSSMTPWPLQHRLRPHGASQDEIEAAARRRIHDFIAATPAGWRPACVESAAQALRRREAARGHRSHPAEEPADPDLRRSHLGARLNNERAIQAELRPSARQDQCWSSRTASRPSPTRTRFW